MFVNNQSFTTVVIYNQVASTSTHIKYANSIAIVSSTNQSTKSTIGGRSISVIPSCSIADSQATVLRSIIFKPSTFIPSIVTMPSCTIIQISFNNTC